MADCQWFNRKFIGFLLIVAIIFSLQFFPIKPAEGKEGPRRHFTSQESHLRREKIKSWKKLKRSERFVQVKKQKVIKLKKSSFWNRKPFQFSTPCISGNKLFVGVDAQIFYALDAENFHKIWEYKTMGPIQSQPVVSEDVVYFGDADGIAYALNASNGSELWKVNLGSPIYTVPLPIQDRIYFTTDSSQLFAIQKSTGSILWKTEPLSNPLGFSVKRGSSPILSGNLIFFGNSQGMLMAYTLDGNLFWARQLSDRQSMISDLDSRPLLHGNCIYAATADKNLFCVEPKNGNILWNISGKGGVNDIALSQEFLFVSNNGVISKIDAANGTIFWEQDLETPEISSPAISNGIIAVISTKDKFYLIDADTGDIIYDRFIRGGSFGDPLFIGDTLYILSNSSRLYAFKIKEKQQKIQKTPPIKRNKNKAK